MRKAVSRRKGLQAIGIGIVIGIVVLWWTVPQLLTDGYPCMADRGAYGDTYGPVTALFTGLAFAFLTFTVYLQHEELGLQRKELEHAVAALEEQSTTMGLQRFENTFFQLMRVHTEAVSALSMRVGTTAQKEEGRRCLWRKRRDLEDELEGFHVDELEIDMRLEGYRRWIANGCEKVLHNRRSEPHLGHYFRQLYHIIKFVDESELEDQAKCEYANLAKAQLDNDELMLLAYSGLSAHGKNFKPLIEKYSLLANLAPGSLLHKEHSDLYSRSAFGEEGYQHRN